MTFHVIIEPEAEVDLVAAFEWYEEQVEGLGHEFLISVQVCLERLEKLPESYQEVFQDVRRAKLKRFPFGILYVVRTETVYVLAVMHSHRDPEGWSERLRKANNL